MEPKVVQLIELREGFWYELSLDKMKIMVTSLIERKKSMYKLISCLRG